MSRKLGLSSFDNYLNDQKQYQEIGQSILQNRANEIETRLQVFQQALITFGKEYKEQINENPHFRSEFSKMCNSFGVDPLIIRRNISSDSNTTTTTNSNSSSTDAQNSKSSVNYEDPSEIYYELSIRVIEICQDTKDLNGGIISISELRRLIESTHALKVEESDIIKSINQLHQIGDELTIIEIGSKKYVKSIPQSLNNDSVLILQTCDILGYVTLNLLRDNFGWRKARCKSVLDDMVSNGLLWIDDQGDEIEYWDFSWTNK